MRIADTYAKPLTIPFAKSFGDTKPKSHGYALRDAERYSESYSYSQCDT
jgi:hypothetical protein